MYIYLFSIIFKEIIKQRNLTDTPTKPKGKGEKINSKEEICQNLRKLKGNGRSALSINRMKESVCEAPAERKEQTKF